MEKAGVSGGSEKSCQALKNIPDVAIAKMIGRNCLALSMNPKKIVELLQKPICEQYRNEFESLLLLLGEP
jgi:hypothetical protein